MSLGLSQATWLAKPSCGQLDQAAPVQSHEHILMYVAVCRYHNEAYQWPRLMLDSRMGSDDHDNGGS